MTSEWVRLRRAVSALEESGFGWLVHALEERQPPGPADLRAREQP